MRRIQALNSIALFTIITTQTVQAACSEGDKLLFECLAQQSGKQILLCDAGKTIDYSFGKPNAKPELALSVPRGSASTYQWQGIGRYMSYAVNVPNGEFNYRVFWGVDRLNEAHPEEAGVQVEKDDGLLATVTCNLKTLEQNLEGVELPLEE